VPGGFTDCANTYAGGTVSFAQPGYSRELDRDGIACE